ncbi:mannosyltransferase [Mycobacterium florentinum]|uniref:mannosyltransferase n=1 Tax=Mycobacterium florentinum TaxID=292462 RepID=UPI0035582423
MVTTDDTPASAVVAKVRRVDTNLAVPAAPIARRLASLMSSAAPLLLVVSIAARLGLTYLTPNGANFVDLHVYLGGAAAIDHPGTLYDFVYSEHTPDFPLPFTYPPFAAIVFYPLHLLPFGLAALLWLVAMMAALYGSVRISQRLLGVARGRGQRVAMAWTAATIWIEPLRNNFDYGQINVFLMLAVLWAIYTTRWSLSGLLVGVASGIKLTPAIAGVYLVGVGRFAAAAFSAVVFFATVALSALIVGDQTRHYFTDLLGDAHRVGPIATAINQSWRGGISRILGYDAGFGPLVLIAIAVTAVLAVLAWRALDSTDRLGKLLVVEMFGLLMSPISWTHHWVWLVPLMMWLIHGPLRERAGMRIAGWGWLALTVVGVPWLLLFAQPNIWQISRPWYFAWAGLAYTLAAVATLVVIAAASKRSAGPDSAPAPQSQTRATSTLG